MGGAALIGIIAALVVVSSSALSSALPPTTKAFLFLGIAGLIGLVQRFHLESSRLTSSTSYDGLADLMIHIHSPGTQGIHDSWMKWFLRSVVSFMLFIAGAPVGAEGAAIEAGQATAIQLRASTARWFEQRRRTDAACALAGGIAASFGAPFAAVIAPMEMGIGGRSLNSVVTALVAYATMKVIDEQSQAVKILDLSAVLYDFRFTSWFGLEALSLLAIAAAAGIAGSLFIRFVRASQNSLNELFAPVPWAKVMFAGVLLFLVAIIYPAGHASPPALLEQVFWSQRSQVEVFLIFLSQLLSITLVMAGFGSMGILWPLLALGGLFGFGASMAIFGVFGTQGVGDPHFSALAGLVGGVSFWGAILGTPVAAAILGYELTKNIYVVIPCLIAGMIGRHLRAKLQTKNLIDADLHSRGMTLSEGRSVLILQSLSVGDVMVSDCETVREEESLNDIHQKLLKSRYQYIPVINSHGVYTGMLTADMVQEAWQAQSEITQTKPLARIFEAKDVLYRVQYRAPAVRASDSLTVTGGLFKDIPCVPVLDENSRVIGLLFGHAVRLAYEREVARRSLVGVHTFG